jgi:hypothetical protein
VTDLDEQHRPVVTFLGSGCWASSRSCAWIALALPELRRYDARALRPEAA